MWQWPISNAPRLEVRAIQEVSGLLDSKVRWQLQMLVWMFPAFACKTFELCGASKAGNLHTKDIHLFHTLSRQKSGAFHDKLEHRVWRRALLREKQANKKISASNSANQCFFLVVLLCFPFVLPRWKKYSFIIKRWYFRNYFLFVFLCLREKHTKFSSLAPNELGACSRLGYSEAWTNTGAEVIPL